MKGFLYILLFTVVAMLSWGVYGPLLGTGVAEMGGGGLRPFICVGLAYFAIAVVVPSVLLQLFGEKGHWSASGVIWSMVAGLCGAVGALGLILAKKHGGSILYIMPVVFGGAPVVNTFVTTFLAKTYKQVGPIFLAGLIVVIAGSVTVLITAPHGPDTGPSLPFAQFLLVCLFIGLTAVSFGCYGPTLHKGQVAMAGSRLRPFLCVGVAYFLVAVLVPLLLLRITNEIGDWSFKGTLWSVGGGAVGAIGALGVIMAFNLGGKPVYVMPLVFGGAPVINTFVEVARHGAWGRIGAIFYAGLILTAAGAVTVLIFAPRSHGAAQPVPAAPAPPKKVETKAGSA